MNAGSTTTRSMPFIPKASFFAAVLSMLPVLWLFLFAKPTDDVGPLAFCLSVSLAVIALVLGLRGLFVARPYAYSVAGIMLSSFVLLLWGFLFLLAIIAAMIALP